jgi:chromosome segregation ATPase
MNIQERMRSMKDDAVNARLSSGLHRAERDRDRLEAENDALRARVSDAEDERSRLLDSLESMSKRTGAARPKRHRLRGAIVLVSAAGSAYVMGSKAGRERYDQLRRWWTDTTAKMKDRAPEDRWDAEAPASVVTSSDVATGS